jgi:hypothetical protein
MAGGLAGTGESMKVEIRGLRSPSLFADRIAPSLLVDMAYVDRVDDDGAVHLSADISLGNLPEEADRTWLVRQIEAALKYHDEPTAGLAYRFEP